VHRTSKSDVQIQGTKVGKRDMSAQLGLICLPDRCCHHDHNSIKHKTGCLDIAPLVSAASAATSLFTVVITHAMTS
jgi:hypothetical protein